MARPRLSFRGLAALLLMYVLWVFGIVLQICVSESRTESRGAAVEVATETTVRSSSKSLMGNLRYFR